MDSRRNTIIHQLSDHKILVVDDDRDIRKILEDRLRKMGCRVISAENGIDALEKIALEGPDVMFLDLKMPKMSGMEVLNRISGNPGLCVIVMTAYGTIQKAVDAMKAGARDFVTKPFSADHISFVLNKALEGITYPLIPGEETQHLKTDISTPFQDIIGESAAFKETVGLAKKVADTSSSVLILGESGTGKEVFARAIHRWSPRSAQPFIVVNCVALRDELLESELFGHEKGAFTGALHLKRGKIEIANGGTVFLDEIGEIKPELQVKLLRVLQEREFERVGGTRSIRVNIRILAATHRNLYREVKRGRFREDLYFRLNVISLKLPPLRKRADDILPLAHYFIRRFCLSLNKEIMQISQNAMKDLQDYHWPGNIRELANLMERAVVLAPGPEITPQDLPLWMEQTLDDTIETLEMTAPYHASTRTFQQKLILNTLAENEQNKTRAAAALGLNRTYLARLIKKLNLT
ncbi:MAG: sigma-54-dependent transcriptional regulator [Nitrospiria bacterium]